uniref:Uncharacterized protein n=1 Tax=Dechloromonas aromatica (strain RCB) TaxID=159087 RepID=Q47CL4_DECAR
MLVEVRLMRCRGRRLSWRDIDHGKVYRGELRTVCAVGGGDRPTAAKLLRLDGLAGNLIPDLHEPALTGFGTEVFNLRGIERLELDDGVYGVVQEWRCTPVIR